MNNAALGTYQRGKDTYHGAHGIHHEKNDFPSLV
jgi:hypothetical protein